MTKELSIFIDESGDFGGYSSHSPFYIVALVLHDQSMDISDEIHSLDWNVLNLGHENHAIHTGPLIRRESIYSNSKMEKRRKVFNALFHFARRANFKYICISIDKRDCRDRIDLIQKISRGLSTEIRRNDSIFQSFNHFIVYYDNGQVELTKIITSVFSSLLDSVEFRKINTVDYKFSQVADLVCTLELMNLKLGKGLTESEKIFFKSERDFKKNIFKYINRKKL